MKIIAELSHFIKDEAKGAKEYAKKAEKYKADMPELPELSNLFLSLASTELDHLDKLHSWVVRFITQEKSKGVQIPQGMLDVWEYEHTEMIDELAETKAILEMAKRK